MAEFVPVDFYSPSRKVYGCSVKTAKELFDIEFCPNLSWDEAMDLFWRSDGATWFGPDRAQVDRRRARSETKLCGQFDRVFGHDTNHADSETYSGSQYRYGAREAYTDFLNRHVVVVFKSRKEMMLL